jgi:hypothetical protein
MIPQDHRGEGWGYSQMSEFPSRCQHLKVNGTQCGSPALRRNRFCFFHKRFRAERIAVNQARARRRAAIFDLPVLEDANSIQVSLTQIMRLIALGHLDSKTAGLLLYALQTASANLRRTNFEPHMHNIVLDPKAVADIPLGAHAWDDEDFEEEVDEEAEREAALEEAQQKLEKEAKLRRWAEQEANRLIHEGQARREKEDREEAARDRVDREQAAQREADVAAHEQTLAERAEHTNKQVEAGIYGPSAQPAETSPRRPPAKVTLEEARAQVRDIIRKGLLPSSG